MLGVSIHSNRNALKLGVEDDIMKKNKNKEFFLFRAKFIFGLQVLISALTTFALYRLNLLPMKYFGIVVALIAVLLLLVGLMLLKSKKNGVVNAGKILSLILSLAMILGTKYVFDGNSFLKKITGADKDTHLISVIVMEDSSYKKFDDVKNLEFAANTGFDKEGITKAQELIKKEFKSDIKTVDYKTYDQLADGLYTGRNQVMLLSEAHRGLIKESHEDFDQKTRVIATVQYEEDSNVKKRDVNVKDETFSIFITGIDTYGPVSTVARSDVNMIMTVNPRQNQVLLTSIPRDYHVKLASKGAYDKLTHSGIYGPMESVNTLENLLDIEIDYYLKVNFSSVERIVDALGGVDVNSQYTFTAFDGNQYQKGMNHVNGQRALSFVRERKSLPNGDSDRGRHQQELIKGIINKAASPAIITNFNSILDSVSDSVVTSMPDNELRTLIKMQVDNPASWDVQTAQLKGTGAYSKTTYSMPGWNLYVMEPDFNSVNNATKLIHDMENNKVIKSSNDN